MPNPRPLLPQMTQFAPHTLHYSPTRPPNHHHLPRISTSRSEHQNNTLIIEHVKPCQLNYNFITSILKSTNIPPKYILSHTFYKKTISITLPTSCTSFLLSQRRVIKSNPTFSHLFIRTDRSHNMRMRGSIIYHAIKQAPSYMISLYCFFHLLSHISIICEYIITFNLIIFTFHLFYQKLAKFVKNYKTQTVFLKSL